MSISGYKRRRVVHALKDGELFQKDIAIKYGVHVSTVNKINCLLKIEIKEDSGSIWGLSKMTGYWELEKDIEISLNPKYKCSELKGDELQIFNTTLPNEWKIKNK